MINMVTERLRKFESSESVDGAASSNSWRQRKPQPPQVGYNSVLSRAAHYEHYSEDHNSEDDQPPQRKFSTWTSPYTTPSGSTASLPQAVPPPEIHKVPPTPPATINFYFRDAKSPASGHSSSMASLEPSPERHRTDEAFRLRLSSEPPEINRSGISRERSPLGGITISYSEGSPSPSSNRGNRRHKAAARQPSYLAAVNTRDGEGQGQ